MVDSDIRIAPTDIGSTRLPLQTAMSIYVAPDHPLAAQGKAFFDLAWTVMPNEGEGETTCPTAARVRVAVPNDAAPLSLDKSFTPCGRKAEVSPFRAEAEPDR